MFNNNNINYNNNNDYVKNQNEEDSSSVLDSIENELKIINNTFLDSLNNIKLFAPFKEKGNEKNMEKTEYNNLKMRENYEEKRNNFDDMLNTYSTQMNEHFKSIFELTNKLKNFEEFNYKEEDLKKKLELLRQKNITSNNKMENKLKSLEKILNDLNVDNSMQKDINKREKDDDLIDEF